MKNLFRKFLCYIGRHDWEYLPLPEGIMTGIFGPRRCKRCPCKHDGFPYPNIPPPPWKKSKEEGDNMPGPVSDSYDPEFGTTQNAQDVKDALIGVRDSIRNLIGEKLKYIVEVAQTKDDPDEIAIAHFTERELRLIRFAINRSLESI